MKYCIRMMPDGNCLFRGLAYVLTGSQSQHFELRTVICNHMYTNEQSMLSLIDPHKTVDDYFRSTKGNLNNVWGASPQIWAFSHLLKINVYVYETNVAKWYLYSPTLKAASRDVKIQSVYLLHPPQHFDVLCAQ